MTNESKTIRRLVEICMRIADETEKNVHKNEKIFFMNIV